MNTRKKFDDIIRSSLLGMKSPAQYADWEAFRKKLEEVSASSRNPEIEKKSDLLIAQKLQKVPVHPSAASTWPLLEKKLRFQALLRDRVFFYKSVELCLVLFFTALAWQWLNDPLPIPSAFNSAAAPVAGIKSLSPAKSSTALSTGVQKTGTATGTETAANGQPPLSSGIFPDKLFDPAQNENTPNQAAATMTTSPTGTLDALPGSRLNLFQLPRYALPEKTSQQHFVKKMDRVMPSIALPQFKFLKRVQEETDEEVFALKNTPKRALFNVAMLGSTDFNRVMTPPNFLFRIKGFNSYSMGYGGGLLFGMEYGRLEIGSGLVYAAKQYRPLPVIFIKGNFQDGYVGESLQTIQLNMINLPVYLRYDALRKDKWRAYLAGGASLQVAFEANYFFAPPSAFLADLAQTPAGESRLRNRIDGWFEGGAFKENSYVTANLSLGVERFVSERWGVFVQPTYHRSFGYFSNGLGPNLDRIHTFSFWTGIRVRVSN